MGTLILIASLVVVAVFGAVLDFGLIKIFVRRTTAFVLCLIALIVSLLLEIGSFYDDRRWWVSSCYGRA